MKGIDPYAAIANFFKPKEVTNMKKQLTAALGLLLTLNLFGCARKAPAETAAPTTVPETAAVTTAPAETTGATQAEDSAALAAYREVLTQIREHSAFPDGTKIELFEPATMDDEQFALADVDGDGEPELLVSVSDTYSAGMRETVYGYDAASGQVTEEAQSFPGCEYYPGLIKDFSSHNQGYAGEVLWPYGVDPYNAETGKYEYKYYVDAWMKEISDTYFDGTKYPEDIDVNHDGYVYLITDKDGNVTILNKTDYEAWEKEQFGTLEQIDIPWQKMTAENVSAVG